MSQDIMGIFFGYLMDVTKRNQGDLFRIYLGYVRILQGYIQVVYLGDKMEFLRDMLIG